MVKIAAIVFALCLVHNTSHAALDLMDHSATGSVVSTPWFASLGDVTVVSLTNALSEPVTVHWTALNEEWQGIDFDCPLSPMETTYFVFEPDGVGGAKVTYECSDITQSNLNIVRTQFIPSGSAPLVGGGFIVFHTTLGAGVPANLRSTNSLIADFTYINFLAGLAMSANGWHHQVQGTNQNNTLMVPAVLATSFIAPDDDVAAQLVLYTLHGRIGWNSPVTVGGLVYDDDEQSLSNTLKYDCITVVNLEDIFGLSVRRENGPGGTPYFVGHLSLFALTDPAAYNPAIGGFGPFRSASVGYLVQAMAIGGDLNDNQSLGSGQPNFGNTMPGSALWTRKLLKTTAETPVCNALDVTQDPPATCGT